MNGYAKKKQTHMYRKQSSDFWRKKARWIDLEGKMLSEISQTEKEIHCMISLICVIYKVQKLMNITKKKQTHKTN